MLTLNPPPDQRKLGGKHQEPRFCTRGKQLRRNPCSGRFEIRAVEPIAAQNNLSPTGNFAQAIADPEFPGYVAQVVITAVEARWARLQREPIANLASRATAGSRACLEHFDFMPRAAQFPRAAETGQACSHDDDRTHSDTPFDERAFDGLFERARQERFEEEDPVAREQSGSK